MAIRLNERSSSSPRYRFADLSGSRTSRAGLTKQDPESDSATCEQREAESQDPGRNFPDICYQLDVDADSNGSEERPPPSDYEPDDEAQEEGEKGEDRLKHGRQVRRGDGVGALPRVSSTRTRIG
jgi:hypothetical protein